MDNARVTISIGSGLLRQIDGLVRERVFSDRGHAIRSVVREGVARLDKRAELRERPSKSAGSGSTIGSAFEKRKWPEF